MAEEKWVKTEEAAARLGKTDRQIRRYCREQLLVCKKEGRQILVEAGSVERLKMKPSPPDAGESPKDVREAADTDIAVSDVREGEHVRQDNEGEPEGVQKALDGEMPEPDIVGQRTPDNGDADMPADIAALSAQLQASVQAVGKSHEAMSDTADQLFQRLVFEHRRNRDMERRLQVMIAELNIQPSIPGIQVWWKKALRRFKMLLP